VTLGSSFAFKIPLPFCKSTNSATFVTNPVPERASVILPTNAARPLNANEGHSPQEVSLVCFSQSKLRAYEATPPARRADFTLSLIMPTARRALSAAPSCQPTTWLIVSPAK